MNRIKRFGSSVKKFIQTRPFASFFVGLGILFLLIVVGNAMRRPPAVKEVEKAAPKHVEVFSNADAPTISLQAKIEKTGALSIYAQSPGVVQAIRKHEGDHVVRGTQLFSLSTNYQGGNAASLTRQLSQKSYHSILDTYDTQKDIIAKQRDVAHMANTQAETLRDISHQSLDDTNALISLNESIVSALSTQIASLPANDPTSTGLKAQQAQIQSGLLQLRSSQRTLSYQTDIEKEPTKLGQAQRDITLKQLDLQEKALDTSRDVAKINVKLASVMESLMYPAAPSTGTIERVFVHQGQLVNPGTLLATLRADVNEAQAIVLVDDVLASQLSSIDASVFTIAGKNVSVRPRVIAREPTEAGLHAITYTLPTAYAASLSQGVFISVKVPLATTRTSLVVPLSAIYQTLEKTYVYVAGDEGGKHVVRLKDITIADVYGDFVPVTAGLTKNDRVIVTRSVKDGDVVEF